MLLYDFFPPACPALDIICGIQSNNVIHEIIYRADLGKAKCKIRDITIRWLQTIKGTES